MEKQVDKYTAVKLEDKGKYGFCLTEGWITQENDFKPSFCKREFGGKDNKTEKTIPVNVKLGDKAKAIEIALGMLFELTGHTYSPDEEKPPVGANGGENDIPF